jgi:dephospho-CoA kinase
MPALKRHRRLILGITGGIATGKSTVLSLLARRGIPTISADRLAHDCIRRGRASYRAILSTFGAQVLGSGKQIDRKKLGKIVFADPKARRKLERIVHPCVLKELQKFVRGKTGLIALDIPLLYEAGYERFVDFVIVVSSTKNRQIERLHRRRGLNRQEALRRIAAQMPLSVKRRRADFVILNSRSLAFLRQQVVALFQEKKLDLR